MTISPPSSRAARWSLVFGILAWVIWCAFLVVFGMMVEGGTDFGSGLDAEALGYTMIFGGGLVVSILSVLLALVGLILGIRALMKRDSQRGMAIAGLVFSLACLLPYLAILLLAVLSGVSLGGS